MSKETDNILRFAALIAVFLFIMGVAEAYEPGSKGCSIACVGLCWLSYKNQTDSCKNCKSHKMKKL